MNAIERDIHLVMIESVTNLAKAVISLSARVKELENKANSTSTITKEIIPWRPE